MAIVCLRCKMWLIFFYICALSAVTSTSELYQYNTDVFEDQPVSISLLSVSEHGAIRWKRAPIEQVISTPGPATVAQAINESSPISSNERPAYQSVEAGSPSAAKPNSTLLLNRNLGVNGTGQRKDTASQKTGEQLVAHTVTTPQTSTTPPSTTRVSTLAPVSTSTVSTPTTEARCNETEGEADCDIDEIAISHHADEILNKTAEESALKTEVDNHEYYKSTFTVDPIKGERYWVDMSNMSTARTNELLSQSHRRAATVKLSFDFPFYGHVVRNVTIATGGFLYTGEYVHSWLAATQYIAPLMANFDTSISNDSYIRYVDNGTAFTVQWDRVCLQDKRDGGEFTFQATLHRNGDIVFVYRHVPVYIESIQDEHHPVKVGLSDAYIIDRTIFFVRRKTIYEYHRVNFNREDIKNWTVIYLSALPTCLVNKDCKSCLTRPTGTFECTWCPSSGRCSNGMDRHRQDWLSKGCERKQLRNESMCALAGTGEVVNIGAGMDTGSHYDTEAGAVGPEHGDPVEDARQASRHITDEQDGGGVASRSDKAGVSMGISGVLTILLMVGLTAGLVTWVLYAYRNPHSASGQMLIKYRPSQWSWRRGEARYTAATIHM